MCERERKKERDKGKEGEREEREREMYDFSPTIFRLDFERWIVVVVIDVVSWSVLLQSVKK